MNNEKKVWLHRCYFAPLFLNFNCKNSGKPALLNYKQLGTLGNIDNKYIFELPEGFLVDDDITNEYEEYVQFLYSIGISKEECLEAIKSNYQQQANRFFDNGLYTIYTSLDRTATQYSEEKISKILQLPNFGFNGLRGELNAALILEIPPKCFEFMGQQQLYENSNKLFKVFTQYHGLLKTSKVVPTQYIKQIVLTYGKQNLQFDNPNFDLEYIPKNNGNGMELFDSFTSQNLRYFIHNSNNADNIIPYALEIKEKATDKEYQNFLRHLLNLCENRENLKSQASFISEELDKFRTPYEKSYVALEKCNLEDISLDKLENIILEFLKNSNTNLKETLNVDVWYKKGNSRIQELLPYLRTSSKFNDIAGEIKNRNSIIAISNFISRYHEIVYIYDAGEKSMLEEIYHVSEEQIPQIRSQYESMNEFFKEIATNSDQNITDNINAFWEKYSNGVISLYEESYVALDKCNPEVISLDKLENIILEFFKYSDINLKETLSLDDWYKKGNSRIQELLPYLRTSSKSNDIEGKVGIRDNIITISNCIDIYYKIIAEYEVGNKKILETYHISEEQIPQIRSQYEAMSESFKDIAANSDQNIGEKLYTFWKKYSNGVISLNPSSDGYKEQPLPNEYNTRLSEFSGRDIGEASYDADTSLCVEAYNIVQEFQRSDMENGHSK